MAENKVKRINQWTRRELLALPARDWRGTSEYDSLLLFSTRRKHDSGWAMMAIVGIRGSQPVEVICEYCDDISWVIHSHDMFHDGRDINAGNLRMDCALKSGAMHAWGHSKKFRVGRALSSVDITVLQTNDR